MALNKYLNVSELKEKDPLKNLSTLDDKKYFTLPSEEALNKAVEAMKAKGFKVHVVDTGAEATELVKGLIPSGASIMNPMSATIAQIGLLEVIKNNTEWKNLHAEILAETDPAKQQDLRRKSFGADYWISGVNAITESGDLIIVDGTGTRTGGWTGAKNVVAISSAQKLVKDVAEANERIDKFCVPLESARYNLLMGWPGARVGTYINFSGSRMFLGDLHVVIIKKEAYGF
jgi:L-lactate utilization protein LutB